MTGGRAPRPDAGARGPALAATHLWFEGNSGWAPPDPETLDDWLAEGSCRAPDDCWVGPAGCCEHGLVSWEVVLDALAEEDRGRPGAGTDRLR